MENYVWVDGSKKPTDVTKNYILDYGHGIYIPAIWDSGMWMTNDLHPLKNPIRWTTKGE